MTAAQAHEIAHQAQRIAWLESELDRRADIISHMADELAAVRQYLDRTAVVSRVWRS